MSDKMDLTRRKVLGGLTTIGVASAAAGAGTMAYFSDTESSSGNTVSAGTLDLKAANDDDPVTTVSVNDVAPGESGSRSTALTNAGSIDGSIDLEFSDAVNKEGENPDSETDTSGSGDLGSVLEVTVSVGGTDVRSGTFNSVFDGTEADANVPLNSGDSKDLTIDWDLPTSAGNDVQGDIVEGDITVELNQTDSDSN